MHHICLARSTGEPLYVITPRRQQETDHVPHRTYNISSIVLLEGAQRSTA